MIFLHFGGSCEPGLALLEPSFKSKAEIIPSPFDWLGIPTEILPELLTLDNWCEQSFDIETLLVYRAQPINYIGVRDTKYHINTVHHFLREGGKNFHEIIARDLPIFKAKMSARWEKVLDTLQKECTIFFREYNPTYFCPKKTREDAIQSVYDALVSFAPKANLVMVCDTQPQVFDKAVVLMQKQHNKERFNQTPDWFDCWDFFVKNDLEKGKIYTPNLFPKTKLKRISR